eukprot:TRINITY_DN1121_c0_g2_i1.p1 TRINITY_DN1121_c0_g2~~TRINITY_DN1121_c0_g2_i1.p1  ORF type:complete len:599 (+),score=47.43 TRINITY_DN1121_c0_g2_i1:204-2000(+)
MALAGNSWLSVTHNALVILVIISGCPCWETSGRVNGQPAVDSCDRDRVILETLVNQTKAQVAQIAQRALDNEYNCGLLQSCVVSRPASVLACTGVTVQADNLTCVNTVDQPNVTQCYNQACHNELLGYNFTSTQFPPGTVIERFTGAVTSSFDYSAAVCKKNFLDLYQRMVPYNRTGTFGNWRYFADKFGIFTKFPFQAITQVTDQTSSNVRCRPYDPRRRPWFTGAISSAKGVVILIDIGSTNNRVAYTTGISGGQAVVTGGQSRLQLSQDIAAALLDTLSVKDEIAIASFDSNVTVLGTGQMFPVATFDQPHLELAALNASIYNLTTTSFPSSGLQAAIEKGLALLQDFTNGCHKILFVISDAEGFGPTLNDITLNATISTAQSDQQQPITPFFVTVGEDNTVGVTNLQRLACSTQGVWMQVQNNDNIFYEMYPYFNFLARTSQYANQQYLSPFYQDFSGLGSVFTVAQLVFDNRTNDFLGIAAGDTAFMQISDLCSSKVQEFLKTLRRLQAPCPRNITTKIPPCVIEAVRGGNSTYCQAFSPTPSSCNFTTVGPICSTPSNLPKNLLRPPGLPVSPRENYCCGSCSAASGLPVAP